MPTSLDGAVGARCGSGTIKRTIVIVVTFTATHTPIWHAAEDTNILFPVQLAVVTLLRTGSGFE